MQMVKLSDRAISVISDLEFQDKYYFTKEDIVKHFENKKQLYNFIYNQRKNKRIIKLNKNKYFLVPIKARYRVWTDNPFIVADEIMNGKSYYIGGKYASKYWGLTDQVPMQIDIYSPNKFGKVKILNKRYVFHRIRPEALKKSVKKKIKGHSFNILKESETKRWILKK
jgi:predicted transcriptional regulator of viral defense system